MKLAIGLVAVFGVLCCLAFWGSADASKDEAIARLAIAGTFVCLFPFVYIWKLIAVPAQLHSENSARSADENEYFEFGNTESKIEVLDAGENFGGIQQYFRLWCPIKVKKKVGPLTIRVNVLRPLQPLDRVPPQYSWKPVEDANFFEGDVADVIFASVARDRTQNGYYGDMRKDAFYIGGISSHLFEIDVLIGAKKYTKRIYLESVPQDHYFTSPRGFGRFGNQFFILEDGADVFEADWVANSRAAIAGKIALPIGKPSSHSSGLLGF